jgi:5-methylcytosine-specific restriction endonuclease McrA
LERHRIYNVNYRIRHPEQRERHAILSAILRYTKPDIYKRHSDVYRERHPEKARYFVARYHARLRGANGGHTLTEWLVIKNSTQGYCPCCGFYIGVSKLTKDHIMSIKLGGSDYAWNLQPLCKHCNSAKGKQIINYLEVWKLVNEDHNMPLEVVRLDKFPIGEVVR